MSWLLDIPIFCCPWLLFCKKKFSYSVLQELFKTLNSEIMVVMVEV